MLMPSSRAIDLGFLVSHNRTISYAFFMISAVFTESMQPVDTQKEIDGSGTIVRHLVRSQLASVQTPQVFSFKPLLEAHRKAVSTKKKFTDDTEIWDEYASKNGRVHVVAGDAANKKITYPADLSCEMNAQTKNAHSAKHSQKTESDAITAY